MDAFVTFTAHFAAGHRIHRGIAHREHGHDWKVAVSSIDTHDWDLEDDLRNLVLPFHLERIEDLLVGGEASMEGIARWLMERLILAHPKVVRIEVWESPDASTVVTREIRGPAR